MSRASTQERIGRFQLIELAGEGGMGSVYRAVDTESGQRVALKVLQPGAARHVDRFVREAQVLAELDHPAIVRHLAHGQADDGQLYLAMEWLDGEDLGDRLKRGPLETREAVGLTRRVAEALSGIHRRGLIHRDIKPSNLFLVDGQIERVKILDFGLVHVDSALGATRTGMQLGTPRYMAPEQARSARDLDARADVFALGAVLFECLAGRPAFDGESLMAILAKILLEEAPRVSELRAGVPEPLDDLCVRMLSKAPAGRPADADEVVHALAEIGDLEGTTRVRMRPPRGLTREELRWLSLVVIGEPEGQISPTGRTRVTLSSEERRELRAGLHGIAREFGGSLEELADGTFVVALADHSSAGDQAARAARAALAMRRSLPGVPMALATGRGAIASRLPVGEVIDRAARLFQVGLDGLQRAEGDDTSGPHGPIFVDDVTAGLLDARFEIRAGAGAGALALISERELLEGHRRLLGKVTPCVGRERELLTLQAIFEEAVAEEVPRAVLVTGPAGIGKSRLREELLGKLLENGRTVEVLWARGDQVSAGSPFGMAAQLVRRAAGLRDGEPAELRQRRLLEYLRPAGDSEEEHRVALFLGELVGAGFSGENSPQLTAARKDSVLMGDQLRRAFEEWILGECRRRPVLVQLEDLQWGDLPTVQVLDATLRRAQDLPLVVLAVARPEVHEVFPDLWAERGVQEVRVGELTRKASERLVRRVLGDGVADARVAAIVERAAGNAFYLEELIRAEAEGKGAAGLPETVLAMAQARIESLPPEARQVLRAASVFGQLFWRGGVTALLGGPQAASDATTWLLELTRREVIEARPEPRFVGEEELRFRHALLQEAAYATLTNEDRVLGHRLAGAYLLEAGERDPMVLAEHFERGQEAAQAMGFYRRAAEQALEGNDLKAVLLRCDRALALGAEGELRGRLHVLAAEAHTWLGEYSQAIQRASCAMEDLAAGSAQWFAAASEVANAAGRMGQQERLVALAEQFLSMHTSRQGTPEDRAFALAAVRTVVMLIFSGRQRLAETLLGHVTGEAGDLIAADPAVAAMLHLAQGLRAVRAGSGVEGMRHYAEAAACAERAGDVRNALRHRGNLGFMHLRMGAYEEGEALLREVVSVAERMGLSIVRIMAQQNLGLALHRLGRLDEAERLMESCMRGFQAQGDRRLEGGTRDYLASILAARGRLDEAEQHARQATEILVVALPLRAKALATLAQIVLQRGQADEALRLARSALELFEFLGQTEEGEQQIRLAVAEALWATGQRDQARAAILKAQRELLERADHIDEPERRRTFLERIPEHVRTLELVRAWSGAG